MFAVTLQGKRGVLIGGLLLKAAIIFGWYGTHGGDEGGVGGELLSRSPLLSSPLSGLRDLLLGGTKVEGCSSSISSSEL